MGLPFRRQPLGNLIRSRELTNKQVARALGTTTVNRVGNLIAGRIYPTATEVEALERLIGLPIQTMFEPELLKYFNPDGSLFSRARRDNSEDER